MNSALQVYRVGQWASLADLEDDLAKLPYVQHLAALKINDFINRRTVLPLDF
jgi:hypothetical protein